MDKSKDDITINQLLAFVDAAEQNRQYPSATAAGYRSALKLFAAEMTAAEQTSLVILREHLERIYQQVFMKNQHNLSAQSLGSYYRRIKSLLNDFSQYGTDPTKFTSWQRPIRQVTRRRRTPLPPRTVTTEAIPTPVSLTSKKIPTNRLELAIREDAMAILIFPADLNPQEATVMKTIIDASTQK